VNLTDEAAELRGRIAEAQDTAATWPASGYLEVHAWALARIHRWETRLRNLLAQQIPTNQSRIAAWVREVFDEATATNVPERALRLAEEALELAQACGVEAAALHRLVDYVFGRPVGEPAQEIAGTMVTLYSTAHALGVNADAAFEAELVRIQQPEVIERVRRVAVVGKSFR
jgi:hypothetical protein